MWHMCGTVKMGKPGEPDACVDKKFRVMGVQGLRVVDMSVAPFVPRLVFLRDFFPAVAVLTILKALIRKR